MSLAPPPQGGRRHQVQHQYCRGDHKGHVRSDAEGEGRSLLSLIAMTTAIAIGAAIAWSGRPELGKTMLVYA